MKVSAALLALAAAAAAAPAPLVAVPPAGEGGGRAGASWGRGFAQPAALKYGTSKYGEALKDHIAAHIQMASDALRYVAREFPREPDADPADCKLGAEYTPTRGRILADFQVAVKTVAPGLPPGPSSSVVSDEAVVSWLDLAANHVSETLGADLNRTPAIVSEMLVWAVILKKLDTAITALYQLPNPNPFDAHGALLRSLIHRGLPFEILYERSCDNDLGPDDCEDVQVLLDELHSLDARLADAHTYFFGARDNVPDHRGGNGGD
ncbi:MAG: hypothetical protein BJ554DRAFT_7763 [Olpidium bornovanus]|uniref:Uncharacterized protein n=1 Tax=Olpidium bornovanus TaxID=278681 RepID=A0A8H7ZVJ4_9FUNG|nr:MAG: hypothetical protein BJ554DRAFT_7763 [Olpidium bornovanus]